MELYGVNFYDVDSWFINGLQRDAVRKIINDMADDRSQEECRYLMRFWWHLAGSPYTSLPEYLDRHVSPAKLHILEELFQAISRDPESVKDWIQKYRRQDD